MCNLKYLRFLKLKFISVIALTFLLSLAFHAYFGRYTFYYFVTEVFTKSEKAELLGNRVSDTCFKTPVAGTVTDFNQYGVEITYDELIPGKYRKVNSDKLTFEKCKILID